MGIYNEEEILVAHIGDPDRIEGPLIEMKGEGTSGITQLSGTGYLKLHGSEGDTFITVGIFDYSPQDFGLSQYTLGYQ